MTKEQACLMGYHILQTVKEARRHIFQSIDDIKANDYCQAWSYLEKARQLLDHAADLQNYLEENTLNLWDAGVITAQSANQLEADEILYTTIHDMIPTKIIPIYLPAHYTQNM